MRHLKSRLVIIMAVISISGCALFTTHYDATRHENFTKLQAFHVKFINDFTLGGSKQWNLNDTSAVCDLGDLKFREALVYAQSRDNEDGTGARAVSILMQQFDEDCQFSKSRAKSFGKAWASEHLEQIELNYGYAIAGELSRVN
jgi:hypothetical protein